jgi:hypothetical protein
MLIDKLRHFLGINQQPERVIKKSLDDMKILMGRMLAQNLTPVKNIADAEFKVFSQWGDDGIIQYLIKKVPDIKPVFIEFGVEEFEESNTRFLLLNNNWKGLIIDGNADFMHHVRGDDLYWRHDLTAVAAFITRDNINGLFISNGFQGKIGLLSIDIDGNDYWVWEKIEAVDPDIVIVEYNAIFGSEHAVTIPYQADFYRTDKHFSDLYWGASLPALVILGERKGYSFIGCNSNGNNAYFVKREKDEGFTSKNAQEGFVESRFRESRDQNRKLTFLSGDERLKMIADMEVTEVTSGKNYTIKSLYKL